MKCIIPGLCICHLQNSNGIMIEYTQFNIPKDVFLLLLSYGWCLFYLCYVMCHLSESGNNIWPCFWSWNLNIKLLSVSSSQSLFSRCRTATSRTCATTRTSSATSTPRWSAPSTTRWTRFSSGEPEKFFLIGEWNLFMSSAVQPMDMLLHCTWM